MSMLYTCIRGQMSNTFFSIGGQMSTPVNHCGGKCPCIPFFTGGQMSEGGNVLHSRNSNRNDLVLNDILKMIF